MAAILTWKAVFVVSFLYLTGNKATDVAASRAPSSWLEWKRSQETANNPIGGNVSNAEMHFPRMRPNPDFPVPDDGDLSSLSFVGQGALQPDDISVQEEAFSLPDHMALTLLDVHTNLTVANQSAPSGNFAVSLPIVVPVVRKNTTTLTDDDERDNTIMTNYNKAQERSYSSGDPAPRIYGLTGDYGGRGWGSPTFTLPEAPLPPYPPMAPMMIMRPPPPPPIAPIIPMHPPPMPPMMMMPPPPIPDVPGVPAAPWIIMPPVPMPPPVPAFSFPSYGGGWGYR